MLLVALLVGLCMPAMAQTSVPTSSTFNVVSLNVEGVPQMLQNRNGYGKTVNEYAIDASGTKVIGQKVKMQSWDVIGLCEDYNFHSQLLDGVKGSSAQTGYYDSNANSSTLVYGHEINETYGLNLLVSERLGTANLNLTPEKKQWKNPSSVDDGNRLLYPEIADYVSDELSLTGDSWAYRGYYRFELTLPNECKVDVYVLHMDAGEDTETSHKNTVARNNQLKDLATAIKTRASSYKRPVIVMGMTNSLYTRENLKANFIDEINAVSALTANDAWVELMRGGKYPVYGTDAETPGSFYFDDQNGEVVNKVFYINNADCGYTIRPNSYLREVANFSNLKNPPVVVSFTVLTNDADVTGNSNWTVSNGITTVPTSDDFLGVQTPSKNKSTAGFLMNVGSGLYLKAGGEWGTQAAEGSGAMPVTIVNSAGVYTITTSCGSVFRATNERIFMDNSTNNTWTFEQVPNKQYQYYIYSNKDGVEWALTSTGGVGNVISGAPLDRSNSRQKWIILTNDETLLANVASKASPLYPFDVTPFVVPGADFDVKNASQFTNWTDEGFVSHGGGDGNPANYATLVYNWKTSENAEKAITVTSTSSIKMPSGNYVASFEGAYRARAYQWNLLSERGTRNYDLDVEVSILNSSSTILGSANVMSENTISLGDGDKDTYNIKFRDTDDYKNSFGFSMSGASALTFKFYKPSFTAGTENVIGATERRFWVGVDNIVVKNLGSNSDAIKIMIANYLYETAQKVRTLNKAGQAAYDVSEVISRYTSSSLSVDGSAEIAMIDAAYEIALKAHKAKEAEDAVNESGGDVTSLIVNPSFEYNNGSTYGWTQAPASLWMDANCAAGGEANIDGTYRFNAWCAGPVVTPIMQTITGLKNGLYELKALIASDAGNVVYLIGNDSHIGKVAVGGNEFVESTLEFLVEDGTAKIGAVGGYDGHFYITGGWYKVDNFRLKYICDPAHGRVYLAHKEASAVYETLDNFGKDYADGKAESYSAGETPLKTLLNTYKDANKTQIASLSKSSGVDEAAAIYSALSEAAFRQKTVGADMTWCFGDPSFEIGKYSQYWSVASGDTWGQFLAARQDDKTYAAVGVEGSYMLNFYDWTDSDALITTIGANSRIPNGIYEVTALVTSDNGCNVFIEAEEDVSEPVTASDLTNADGAVVLPAGRRMFPIKHQFEVTDGTATIKIYAKNSEGNAHNFFKVDDFHLHIRLLASYQEPTEKYDNNNTLYLDENSTEIPELPVFTKSVENTNFQYNRVEITRGISSRKWSTLVVPFDMPVSDLGDGNWDVRELTSAEVKTITAADGTEKEDVVISFTTPTDNTIKMGKCYIVRHETQSLSTVVMDAGNDVIAINTSEFDYSFNTANNKLVEFVGTYTNGFVPAGSYFISNNLFKKAVNENTNKIKGFRAYFNVKTSAGARGLSFRVGESTDIESANNDEVTIVGIYNLSGMRLNDMEPGVNILHMSDGTSVKVIIK